MFRTLISLDLPLQQIVERASCIFCESTLSSHYGTLRLVWGRRGRALQCALLPPLLIDRQGANCVAASGLLLGLFCGERFEAVRLQLDPGDALLLYTDGITEAQDEAGNEFGRA